MTSESQKPHNLGEDINQSNHSSELLNLFQKSVDGFLSEIKATPVDNMVAHQAIKNEINKIFFENPTDDLLIDTHEGLSKAANRIGVVLLRHILIAYNSLVNEYSPDDLQGKRISMSAAVNSVSKVLDPDTGNELKTKCEELLKLSIEQNKLEYIKNPEKVFREVVSASAKEIFTDLLNKALFKLIKAHTSK